MASRPHVRTCFVLMVSYGFCHLTAGARCFALHSTALLDPWWAAGGRKMAPEDDVLVPDMVKAHDVADWLGICRGPCSTMG